MNEVHLGEGYFMVISALLFLIGLIGFSLRRNLIVVLVSIEIMVNGLILFLATIAYYHLNPAGYVMVFFVIAMAAAEGAVGLTLLVLIYKKLNTVHTDKLKELQG